MACSSQMKVSEYVFEWECEFDRNAKYNVPVESGLFYAGLENKTTWRILFFPGGDINSPSDMAACHLKLISEQARSINLSLYVDENGCNLASGSLYLTSMRKGDVFKFSNLIEKKKLFFAIAIRCTLTLNEYKNKLPYSCNAEDSSHQVAEDISCLLSDLKHADVVLVADGTEEFQAHKLILGARSPVFDAMFQHDMEENRSNRVCIPEVSGIVLKEMLHFIYSGKPSSWTSELAMDLFVLGDKYKINGLKETCTGYLTRRLTHETAAKACILGHMHSDEKLKVTAKHFIMRNVDAVLDTTHWNILVNEHQDLVNDIIESMGKYWNAAWK